MRDQRLLDLRTALAGPRVECETDCPTCGERLDIELDADRLRAEPPDPSVGTVRRGRRTIHVRPPDSRDIAACLGAGDPERELLDRCTDLGDGPIADEVREAVAREMAALDPGAEILLDAACPACDERWEVPLDVASLAFEDVTQIATRLLREVDQLARAYGWRERDVLGLSAERRRAYVALAAQ